MNLQEQIGGPNIYNKGSEKIYNNYYFLDETFPDEFEIKGSKLSLWDAEFQNQILNGDEAFIVDELVNEGYYPHLNMPDCMPMQEFIELPEVEDADLPDILSTKVLEQGTDTVKVQFSVNNPSSEQISEINIANLDVEILSQEYKDGKSTVIAELKNPDICVSSYNVISLSTSGAFGSGYTRPYDPGERVINVDLYKEIWNINDWKEINDSPTENYMLMEDLNCINEENTVALNNINGIINGNGRTISNINLSGDTSLISSLSGTIQNLHIKNVKQEVCDSGGLIYVASTGSLVDNVHLTDMNINKTGQGCAGGLVRSATFATIKNCSINNISIATQNTQNDMYLGGYAGMIGNTTMENCYVTGVDIKDTKGVNSGIGGLIGAGEETISIRNCYAEGKIKSDNLNVGGIVGSIGSANVENCYSKVNISTANNFVGGIVGIYSGNNIENITNNISLGNIYTTSGINALNRIIGNSTDISANNYAYEKQLLNGYISEEAKDATLLSKEEILNLNLGISYNYDKKEEGVLPKLFNVEGTELLPNQEDIFLEDSEADEGVRLEVENIEIEKPNTTEAEITVKIKNPNEIEITGIVIEDMETSSVTRNVTQNGITSITVRATPIRYYDSYKLTGIKYKKEIEEEQTKEVENEIPVQFYKEIYTYEDWQSIEEGTYQNYRLMADIDFSGRTNIKNNITVNRLEAENNIYTLKNIDMTFDVANTGLINNVKTNIKNIGFENITLINIASTGEYFGMIASSNGNIENLKFNEIIIDASGLSYVGIVGSETSGNINNIELKNIDIKGNNYIGGVAGLVDSDIPSKIYNINANNIKIEGNGNYVGGIIGKIDGELIVNNKLTVESSNLSGKNYVGGIFGYVEGTNTEYLKVINTDIAGASYVGGVGGLFNAPGTGVYNRLYLEVNSSNINSSGNNIGGIVGQLNHGEAQFWKVDGVTINAPSANSTYVGGACGTLFWCYARNYQILNLNIFSNGKNIGGFCGQNYGQISANSGYIWNSILKGGSNVGGVIGNFNYGNIDSVYVNALIEANNTSAGGIIGLLDNSSMTATLNSSYCRNVMVLDSTIKSPTKSGGLIGDIATEIYRDQSFYYNNYIDADVTSENVSTGSLIIGGRPDENEYIENTYVYKYSTLNGNYVYTTNDNIDTNQYLVRADLNNQSTYSSKIGLGTTYWNYASLSEGKYPKIKDSYLYQPELQTGVDLPIDPEVAEINTLSIGNENNANKPSLQNSLANRNNIESENATTQTSSELLPTYKIYPVSVNEINVDFSLGANIDGTNTTFTYYVNGEPKETIELSNNSKQTYTFKYNFKDTLEIKLTKEGGIAAKTKTDTNATITANDTTTNETTANETTITITPDMVRNTASLVGENYAYLNGTNLYDNGKIRTGEYVNIYEGLALNNDGTVINIATNEIVEQDVTTALEKVLENTLENKDVATPLATYNYKDYVINTYGTYSTVNGNIKNQIYNVRSGKLSALSNSLEMKIGNSIIDNYNNKEYQTILSSNGELVDLKEMLQYPENFLNRNIKQIAQNTNEEKPEVMVLYETGKVIVFNYVTGEMVYENNEKANNGIADYIEGSVSKIWSDYENKQIEYEKGKELAEKLEKMPIEEAMKQPENGNNQDTQEGITATNTISNTGSENSINNDSYITVYDGNTEEYDVYSENEILGGEEEEPVSETTKIKQNGLEKVYSYDAREETKPQTNGAMIVVAIIVVAVIALVVLRKIVVKNNTKGKK